MSFGRLERTTGAQPMSDINMTPLVDVMLVLVVIFILTAPLLASSIRLDLPQAEGAGQHVLGHGHGAEHPPPLGRVADPQARPALAGHRGQVAPGEAHPARGGHQPDHGVQRAGLARPVGAHQQHGLAGGHVQRHAAHGGDPAVADAEPVELQDHAAATGASSPDSSSASPT